MNENKFALAIKLECNTNFCFLVLGHPFQNELFSGKLFSLMSKCSNSNKIYLSFGSRLIASRGPTFLVPSIRRGHHDPKSPYMKLKSRWTFVADNWQKWSSFKSNQAIKKYLQVVWDNTEINIIIKSSRGNQFRLSRNWYLQKIWH